MISSAERAALTTLSLNPAQTPDDVWRSSPYDVPELHEPVVGAILRGVGKARTGEDTNPLGVAMQGRAGSGKTHLLGAVRERIQRDGGYFFLINLISGKTFWESTALCIVEGMAQDAIGWGTQLKTFLRRLTPYLGIAVEVRDAVAGDAPLTRDHLDTFIRALRMFNEQVGQECQDTARALVLFGSLEMDERDIGWAHLISVPGDPADRSTWGLSAAVRSPQQIVRDISHLVALTLSPTVLAIDQLDTLFAQTSTSLVHRYRGLEEAQAKVVGPVVDGLIRLRDITRRTLTVVSCLPDTWELLEKSAPGPFADRFRKAVLPDRIPTVEIGQAIVAKRFTAMFKTQHFHAPYPTWPIKPTAFRDAPDLTPRALLRRIDHHISGCLDRDTIVELERLVDGDVPPPATPPGQKSNGVKVNFQPLDDRFRELTTAAEVSAALDHRTEDRQIPTLLGAGLAAWIIEQSSAQATFRRGPLPNSRPALHGRLIEVLNEDSDDEASWNFRAIGSTSPLAVINRVTAAATMAGLDPEIPQRRLVLIRDGDWPTGKRTAETIDAFTAAGGMYRSVSEEDLKILTAIRDMSTEPDADFQAWLMERRPASHVQLFRDVLGDPSAATTTPDGPETGDTDKPGTTVTEAEKEVSIALGHRTHDRAQFEVDVESLRRHSVIFAGSGSGKTVLIRRLVEECARKGVSSIVLDPNNDLARLGDAWPEPPAGWGPGDDVRARDYLDHTEVVVWTPRVTSGRPISFQPLPDFAPVRDSPDEFDQAIRSAVEALAPRAGVNGATKPAQHGKAVLTEALMAYAYNGGVGLRGFTEFLAELPAGVSSLARATKLAHDLAETLKAAMVTDPLFGGTGTAADPGMLLTPSTGKRARVSVISFVGLNSNEERQSFVNQLQMALFAWIKSHPAGDRPLGGLFVMDEAQTFAPSSGNTPCTASSISLASQARKYGLGLVFATQSPRGLHNQISGNATTQFFGLLNAPAQIDAARELAHAKGGKLPDIGLLNRGQFYAAGEGFSFVKVNTPLCLTHHPKSPLTPEEVIERAN